VAAIAAIFRSEERAAANYDGAALSFPYWNPSRAKPEGLVSAATAAAALSAACLEALNWAPT